jgi:hypothetical protein
MAEIGAVCDDDEACSQAFPFCHQAGDEPYCTVQGCEATSCPAGYACEQGEDATFCGKLPSGLNEACSDASDCADYAANFCDTMVTNTCILTGCAADLSICPGFYTCCAFGPDFSVCVPPGAGCAPGMAVTP